MNQGFAMEKGKASCAMITLLLAAVFLASACRIFHTAPEPRGQTGHFYKERGSSLRNTEAVPPESEEERSILKEVLGTSVEGRPITGFVLGQGEETVLLLGGIHGNAPGGETVLQALVDLFTANPGIASGRRLVIVPSCNPDGLEAESKLNANNVDLNLNFPTSYWELDQDMVDDSGFEPETEALMNAVETYSPDVAVLIHSPGGSIDFEGPGAKEMALKVSNACRLPLCKTKSPPGSLGAYLGKEKRVPLIIIELDYRHKRGVISPFEKERMTNTLLDLLDME